MLRPPFEKLRSQHSIAGRSLVTKKIPGTGRSLVPNKSGHGTKLRGEKRDRIKKHGTKPRAGTLRARDEASCAQAAGTGRSPRLEQVKDQLPGQRHQERPAATSAGAAETRRPARHQRGPGLSPRREDRRPGPQKIRIILRTGHCKCSPSQSESSPTGPYAAWLLRVIRVVGSSDLRDVRFPY